MARLSLLNAWPSAYMAPATPATERKATLCRGSPSPLRGGSRAKRAGWGSKLWVRRLLIPNSDPHPDRLRFAQAVDPPHQGRSRPSSTGMGRLTSCARLPRHPNVLGNRHDRAAEDRGGRHRRRDARDRAAGAQGCARAGAGADRAEGQGARRHRRGHPRSARPTSSPPMPRTWPRPSAAAPTPPSSTASRSTTSASPPWPTAST